MSQTSLAKIVLLVYALIHGVIFWLVQKGSLPAVLVPLSIAFFGALCLGWMYLDARATNKAAPAWLKIFVLLLPVVGAPVYLFQYRDDTRRYGSLLGFVGFVVLASVLYMVGTFVADVL